jgi:hypothetical protein
VEGQIDYRIGSPFASEPAPTQSDNAPKSDDNQSPAGVTFLGPSLAGPPPETLSQGVWGQTAQSALIASAALSLFGSAGYIFFPAGGIAVASLGFVVSLLAITSNRPRWASVLLAFHAGIFVVCYLGTI